MTELFFKVLDFALGGLLEKWRRRKALSERLEALKRHVLNVSLVNDYPVELARLRTFLLESGLVERPQFRAFFGKWLANPIVAQGRPVIGLFSKEQIMELREELVCLQL